MVMLNSNDTDLRTVVTGWLLTKLSQAERLRERSLRLVTHEQSEYAQQQYRYSKHLTASLKWLIANVPKRFANHVVSGKPIDAETVDITVEMVEAFDQCQLLNR